MANGTPGRICQRCHTRLSRYNSDQLCGGCARHGGDLNVPPGLWQLGPVREALAQDDVGALFRAARCALGWSQIELANLLSSDDLPFSQAKVSRVEAGVSRVRDIDELRRISEVLGIPPQLLGLSLTSRYTGASLILPPTATAAEKGGHRTGERMQRRSVLVGAAALVGLTLGSPLSEDGTRRVGRAHVRQLETALSQLWALDDRYGGDDIHQLAVGLLDRVQAMLNYGNYDDAVGSQLAILSGRMAEHAGWLSFDAGRHDHSRYFLTEALTAAHVAQDEELEVLVLGSLSLQASSVGRRREAVALAQRAQDTALARRTSGAMVMAAFREARAFGQLGERRSANKAMLKAEKAFGRVSDRPAWVAYLDEAELTAKIAYTTAALGEAKAAAALFEQALDNQRPSYGRNRALYSAYLAHAHMSADDVDQGAGVGLRALALAEQVTSRRTLRQYVRLRDRLATYPKLAPAREYVEQFDARFGLQSVAMSEPQ